MLTAVEDLLSSAERRRWESLTMPAANGLAILYHAAADTSVPDVCLDHLGSLRGAITLSEKFLQTYETT